MATLSACSGGNSSLPSTPSFNTAFAASDIVNPYTPGVETAPSVVTASVTRPPTMQEVTAESELANRISSLHRSVSSQSRYTMNTFTGNEGEGLGMYTSPTFSAQGSVVNIGVQKNYYVQGGNFFHTHQFVNNQCFEYGINYSYVAPTLFAYNWCTGGNTPQGMINKGMVGSPGGILNTWDAANKGWMFKWDAANNIYEISLEEVQEKDGWHLLGYNWGKLQFVDLMGYGVTGSKNQCCGWDVMEIYNNVGQPCNFEPTFPKGNILLYDVKKQVMINGRWTSLDMVPQGQWSFESTIDCANLTGKSLPNYVSPYFSGNYVPFSTYPTSSSYPGDWKVIQS